jgi:hypothetical protein
LGNTVKDRPASDGRARLYVYFASHAATVASEMATLSNARTRYAAIAMPSLSPWAIDFVPAESRRPCVPAGTLQLTDLHWWFDPIWYGVKYEPD